MRSNTFMLSAALILGLSAVSSAQTAHETSSKAMGKDAMFAQKASTGGEQEVKLAQAANAKLMNDDAKSFADRIVKDHTMANEELMSIMKTKTMTGGTMAAEKMEMWQSKSGSAYDRGFIDHMITDHKKDIALFEAEAKSGTDAELKAFATKTLPTLREHLKMAQDLKSKMSSSTTKQ